MAVRTSLLGIGAKHSPSSGDGTSMTSFFVLEHPLVRVMG